MVGWWVWVINLPLYLGLSRSMGWEPNEHQPFRDFPIPFDMVALPNAVVSGIIKKWRRSLKRICSRFRKMLEWWCSWVASSTASLSTTFRDGYQTLLMFVCIWDHQPMMIREVNPKWPRCDKMIQCWFISDLRITVHEIWKLCPWLELATLR